jgi:hypothetical protein
MQSVQVNVAVSNHSGQTAFVVVEGGLLELRADNAVAVDPAMGGLTFFLKQGRFHWPYRLPQRRLLGGAHLEEVVMSPEDVCSMLMALKEAGFYPDQTYAPNKSKDLAGVYLHRVITPAYLAAAVTHVRTARK